MRRAFVQLVARFALGDSSGAPVADAVAQALADACAVKVTLADGSDCVTYDPTTHAFVSQVPTSTSGTYPLEVRVTVGGALVATGSRPVQVTSR